jgi:alpha-mannosidase
MDKKKAYVVATAHLDTVWRWTLAKTIEEYIPDTLSKNFDLIEKYPNYRFNFEGAKRYELIEEFYPKAFEKIKEYVKEGKWCISGTAYENGDVNIPSPEALFRNLLIGNNYFKEKFGTTSKDVFLPDCFGFSWSLPSIINHAGLKGFTTQKLSWGSAYGLPFDLGRWQGPDGNEAYVSLNAKSYRYKFSGDVRADISIIDRIADNYATSKLPWANHLYGTGDWGGSPTEESVKSVNESVNKHDDDFEIISASSDQIFLDLDKLPKKDKDALPVWNNELIMTSHGAGTYTSRCMSKYLNRTCERFGETSEKACAFSSSIGKYTYPRTNLNNAWKRMLQHQFHDDITGTSWMEVYNTAWSDYYLSITQFATEYAGASKAIASELDTSWANDTSSVIIVNNPTQYKVKKVFETHVKMSRNCSSVGVFDKDGNEVPSQIVGKVGKNLTVAILAEIEPFGYRAFEVRKSTTKFQFEDCTVYAGNHSLENDKYKIIFNRNGDIAYLYDKKLGKQIIESPIKMAVMHDTGSLAYPSWEITKEDIDKEPYCYANTPVFSVLESGPLRASIKVVREAEYSTITQIVTLSKDSEYVEVKNIVDWKTRRSMLKATFPLSAHNEKATYDLGLGVIQRGTNTEKLYEVPAQKWADLSDKSGEFGISIFSDSKYGWDKPNDNTLRLTCIHTPAGAFTKETRQDLQDIGRNVFTFAIYSHKNGFENDTQKYSEIFANPYPCIEAKGIHKGKFGDRISFCNISNDNVIVRAIKLAEDDDSFIIRINEAVGKEQRNVSIKMLSEIVEAQLCTALEEPIKELNVINGGIRFNMKPFEVKTFKIKCKNADAEKSSIEEYVPYPLQYNSKGFTTEENMRHVILQGSGFSLPYEQLKDEIHIGGIKFKFPKDAESRYDVMVSRGQHIKLPKCTKVYFIAGSTGEDQDIFINYGVKQVPFKIKSISQPANKWDMAGLDQVADASEKMILGYEFTHVHHPEGNLAKKAQFYLYSLSIFTNEPVTLELPENNRVVFLAMTTVDEKQPIELATPMFDTVTNEYDFNEDIPPIDKVIDKADFVTIRAGKIQDQVNSGKGKGFKRDNIITNIIRSYTKSEW